MSSTPFSDNFQMICALITHLGCYEKHDTRPVNNIADSLEMEEAKVERVLEAFPCFFRESKNHGVKQNDKGKRRFAVHVRYARRKENGLGEEFSEPMTPAEVGMLINVAMQMVTLEKQEQQFMTEIKKQELQFTEQMKRQEKGIQMAIRVALISAAASIISAILALIVKLT